MRTVLRVEQGERLLVEWDLPGDRARYLRVTAVVEPYLDGLVGSVLLTLRREPVLAPLGILRDRPEPLHLEAWCGVPDQGSGRVLNDHDLRGVQVLHGAWREVDPHGAEDADQDRLDRVRRATGFVHASPLRLLRHWFSG